MTDQDVIELYRCLLGRAPENANTIAAFRHYYPDFDAGRRAVLTSDEFRIFAARVTGETAKREAVSGPLAQALLAAVGVVAADAGAPDALLREGFRLQFGKLEQPRLAVLVGDAGDRRLDDLAVMGGAEAAVLQIPARPAGLLARPLADGTMLLQSPWAAPATCSFLGGQGLEIDALFVLEPPADLTSLQALVRLLRPQAFVAISVTGGFDAAAVSRLVASVRPGEPPLEWRGFLIQHLGGWLLPVRYAAPPRPVPQAKAMASVAVAAIVRDEAACVVNMLRSALPFAQFIAVLDTGSIDGTPGLVKSFLESAGVPSAFDIIDHERFEDRFSDMRNTAVAMVPPAYEWVLMLDADEEMAAEDVPVLQALIAEGGCDAYALPRYNYRGADTSGEVSPYPDRQVRLLRHGAGPRPLYSGSVHETVRGWELGNPRLDASALGGARGGPHIHHLVRRFKNTEAEDEKQAFYKRIARRHQDADAMIRTPER